MPSSPSLPSRARIALVWLAPFALVRGAPAFALVCATGMLAVCIAALFQRALTGRHE